MRRSDWLVGIVGALAAFAGAGVMASACSVNLDDCDQYPLASCLSGGTGGTGGATSSSSSSTSSSGGGGTGGSTPASCIPSGNTMPVEDTCGVFVSSTLGDDMNAGTKEKPIKTLVKALALAKGKPVYACGESFTETVTISADATIYGAVDCTKMWAYDPAKKTQLTTAADAIPLTITTSGTSTDVYDFAIAAANASKDGGSSIGTLVTQATASFTRCDITAGDGKAGTAGAPFGGSAATGTLGEAGKDACLADQSFGGKTVTNACGTPDSISGAGGIGDVSVGGTGANGQPGTNMNGGPGQGGALCSGGGDGDPGGAGGPGAGAATLGLLSANGYTGESGTDGKTGVPGQGGGGGGGAKGGTGTGKCATAGMTGGASGGSGGSGGCGGAGGKGGTAGGSSIALASINGTLLLNSVSLKAGGGGLGGNGGTGQSGGNGGEPGLGGKAKPTYASLNDACPGGKGGVGGPGGKGGGGRGGHSVGIAFTGKAPPAASAATWKATTGAAGMGGTGDTANGNMGNGADGAKADMQQFQ